MNPELVGEPGVSAFLRSVLRNLGDISRMKPNDHGTDVYYDPTQDLEKLRRKLVFFQGLVVDGEAKRLADPGVDEWMDDINDLLYDVEDIFDDIKSLRKDPQVSINYELLQKFSDDIKDRLGKILGRTDELVGSSKDLDLQRRGGRAFPGDSKATLRTPETSSVVDISEIHGREDDKTDIVKRLLLVDGAKGKKNYDVLCIVGMGGLGKTTLAQLVFNDPEVVKHFDVKSWVCISNVFKVKAATKELIEKSGNSADGGSRSDQQSLDNLQNCLKGMVENKRFLFVLDDVWSAREWEKMKAPFNSCLNGSQILVTTRNIQIAPALGNTNPYPLKALNDEKCMEIFRDRAFGNDEGDQEKADLVQVIVRACNGVPLVVKVIGSLLRGAGVEKWRAVSNNTATWDNKNDEILPAIRLSYYDLPAPLKRCFEYLAVFPPDYYFEQDDIVALWIADGLVQEVEGRKAEDIGNEYYNALKGRSLIQENDRMHDIVHDLASVLSRKFCYRENSQEPAASVRHAFFVKLKEKHCEFLAQAPCLRTLIVKKLEDANNFRNTIRFCKMLRTFIILKNPPDLVMEIGSSLSLGESFVDHLTCHIRYLAIVDSDIRHLPDSLCMMSNLQLLNFSGNSFLENLPDTVNHLSNLRFLKVAQSSILSLPDSICTLSQLQVLNLEECGSLKELPNDIGNLKSLRTLDLESTSISSLPDSICTLSQLQVLNLEECGSFKELPNDIGNLKSLRTLDLESTSISSLPDSICTLSQLQVLNLEECGSFKELPNDIGNLKSLRTLDLKSTSISSLPDSICTLSQLQVLNLEECGSFKELPNDIGNLKSLRTLDLESTSISSLPDSICTLSQLQILNLQQCRSVKELPKDIGNLRSLQTLRLRWTSISSLPDSICTLSQLQILNLQQCRSVKELPKDIGNLRSLKTLDLGNTSISSLPDSICTLSQLQVLNLQECGSLKDLPKDIGNLRSLQTLDLRFTSISSLPDSICAMSQLQVLNLEYCCSLQELPKDIRNLRSLQTLDLQSTSISSLSDSICTLSQLRVLNLHGCRSLKELPKDMRNLRSLKTLDLQRTSISSLPDSICALCQLQVLRLSYCGSLQELPKDIGKLMSLRTLDLRKTSILSVPESILNFTRLENLFVDKHQQLPSHMGRLARSLEELPIYNVGKEVGRCLRELNLMNRLKGRLKINNMENVGGVEEAKKANLKSKKKVWGLEFCWSQPGNVEEMEVKIMEALEPHHALQYLRFTNYGGDRFPAWIMSSNVCFSNLGYLKMEGLNKICEMIDMEFVSLEELWLENCPILRKVLMATPKLKKSTIKNCPILRKVLMATPKLKRLYMKNCGELEGNSVHLLPSLSDKAGMHSIVSQFESLECDYNIFEYFFEMLKTTNLKGDKLEDIKLRASGRRVASLPDGWLTIMKHLGRMKINDIAAGKFQFLPDGDQIAFPPSLYSLYINHCSIYERPFRHSYTITVDGIVEQEEESEEVEDNDSV